MTNVSGLKLAVAIGLNENDAQLLEKSKEIAKLCKGSLHLVHGVEAIASVAWAEGYYIPDPAFEKALLQSAQQELQNLQANCVKSDIPTTIDVRMAPAGIAVANSAKDAQCDGIIVSVRPIGIMGARFSTALTLCANAQVPVIVINGGEVSWKGGGRAVLADDLQNADARNFERSVRFLHSLGFDKFEHVHVIPPFHAESWRTSVREFLVARWPGENASAEFEDRVATLKTVAMKKMTEKRSAVDGFLKENKCEMRAHVRRGSVSEELFRFSSEHGGNLVVFGRHHALHTKPLSLGKVPLNTMLTSRLPVCVFPST